jgi:hypothetical protein
VGADRAARYHTPMVLRVDHRGRGLAVPRRHPRRRGDRLPPCCISGPGSRRWDGCGGSAPNTADGSTRFSCSDTSTRNRDTPRTRARHTGHKSPTHRAPGGDTPCRGAQAGRAVRAARVADVRGVGAVPLHPLPAGFPAGTGRRSSTAAPSPVQQQHQRQPGHDQAMGQQSHHLDPSQHEIDGAEQGEHTHEGAQHRYQPRRPRGLQRDPQKTGPDRQVPCRSFVRHVCHGRTTQRHTGGHRRTRRVHGEQAAQRQTHLADRDHREQDPRDPAHRDRPCRRRRCQYGIHQIRAGNCDPGAGQPGDPGRAVGEATALRARRQVLLDRPPLIGGVLAIQLGRHRLPALCTRHTVMVVVLVFRVPGGWDETTTCAHAARNTRPRIGTLWTWECNGTCQPPLT